MDVQDQESLRRWDGLGSRDASSRNAAMENIRQEVIRRVEDIGPIPASSPRAPALGSPPSSDLNDILAHLLMLSKQCPFEDVRERCVRLLQAVQVGHPIVLGALWCGEMHGEPFRTKWSDAASGCHMSLSWWCWCYCSAAICSSLHLPISTANIVVESEPFPDWVHVVWSE